MVNAYALMHAPTDVSPAIDNGYCMPVRPVQRRPFIHCHHAYGSRHGCMGDASADAGMGGGCRRRERDRARERQGARASS